MTVVPDNPPGEAHGWGGRAVALAYATISLTLAVLFTLGTAFMDLRDLGGWTGRGLMGLLAATCWTLGAGHLLTGLAPGRYERCDKRLTMIGMACFVVFVLGIGLRWALGHEPPAPDMPARRISLPGPTFLVLLAAYALTVVVLFVVGLTNRATSKPATDATKSTALGVLIFLWPILLLGVMPPLQSLTLYGLAIVFTYGGERLGALWGYPLWGASLGLALFLAAGIAFLAWAGRKGES